MSKLIDRLAVEVGRRRKQKGLSQEVFGKLAGLSKQSIWNIENGKTGVSFDTIGGLAKALECEETDLVTPSRSILPEKELPNKFVHFRRNPNIKMILGDNLARLLNERKLTQTEFAHQLGLTFQTVNRYINGKAGISDQMISKLATTLGVDETELIRMPTAALPDMEFQKESVEFIRETLVTLDKFAKVLGVKIKDLIKD